ncbi:protein kinase domain-containing protein [Thermococcus zilligii]|uniref:protein kinase domain-containing protein n=1 Tax=Thermococcus zilligii TaxID=54076 RepID=UPI00029AAA2A|nr:PEGA domain-containing protein [Thermococcus zilligii]
MKKLPTVLALTLAFSLLAVQIPAVTAGASNYWAKSYGGQSDDFINDVKVLPDGGIIAVGSTASFGAGEKDVLVMKLNPDGSLAWAKTYGGIDYDEASAVALADNGDIIVAGHTSSFGAGYEDVWVLRLDKNGNIKWQKTYGGISSDRASAVALADNGDIIVAGYTESFGASGHYFWVLRLDANGNIKWQKTYGGSWARAVALADNEDIIVAGYTWSFGAGGGDVWVLRLDENGNVKWQKTYGGSHGDWVYAVALADNGDIIVAGYYGLTDWVGSNADVWILRLDEDGNIKWQKTYGGSWARAVALADNEDIIVAGYTSSFVWVLRLDADGNIKWQKTYGGSGHDEAHAVAVAPNGDIIVAGVTASFGAGGWDAWVLRLPPDGNLPDFSKNSDAKVNVPNPIITSPNAEVHVSNAQVEDSNVYPLPASLVVQTQYSPATLTIQSNPSGAKVILDGSYAGETPLTIQVPPGTHSIILIKDGYQEYRTTITLSPEESKAISATLITSTTPPYGYLTVYSDPSGARVFIDDSYVGDTPIENYKLPTGEHTVKIVKQGYQDFTKTVTVTPGGEASITASLTPIQATSSSRVTTNSPSPSTTGSSSLSTSTSNSSQVTNSQTQTVGRSTEGGISKTDILLGLIFLGLILLGFILLGIALFRLIGALLRLIGGVAAKTGSGKPKPSPESAGKTAPEKKEKPPAPAPAGKPPAFPGFPPELLDKYEPLEFLGEGGFAKVFKVKRKDDGKIVALKIPNLDEKARKFLLKEAKAWSLLDHPNIVKLYNAFDEPLPHLEIEFVDGVKINGKTIRDLGKYPKPVDEEKALHFVRGIAEGLKHAHSKRIFHRDLKPQNVLIKSDLTPKITDWGLAKVGAASTTATTTRGLTLLYAAPEQLDEETYGHTDQRTDIYQLGLIFYELLTGELPYQGTSPAAVVAKVINPDVKPIPPSHFDSKLAKYDGIFEKLLAKRKEDRYQSVDEFLKDLELIRKLEEEKARLAEEIEKTKTTMSLTTDSKELRKLRRRLVEQLSRNALLLAQLNDKVELIKTLEDLKAFSKEHREELENAIGQFEVMMRESVPISKSTLDELEVLLHKVQREVEE